MPLTDDFWTIIFPGGIILAMVMMIGFAIYHDHEHVVFLREHGCQVVFEHETGRSVRHGKTFGPEIITLYECADGNRTEVH